MAYRAYKPVEGPPQAWTIWQLVILEYASGHIELEFHWPGYSVPPTHSIDPAMIPAMIRWGAHDKVAAALWAVMLGQDGHFNRPGDAMMNTIRRALNLHLEALYDERLRNEMARDAANDERYGNWLQ